jgi:hypothetical protein
LPDAADRAGEAGRWASLSNWAMQQVVEPLGVLPGGLLLWTAAARE